MACPFAFVTLLSSDAYLPGALVLAASLRDIHPQPPTDPEVDFKTVCLVTPESVDVQSIKALRKAFDLVVGVEILEGETAAGLKLLGRPDLTTVLTKLHVFRLTEFKKLIFLDADVLPLQPISHLFLLPHEFSACPDVGWPDIFNSGCLVLEPGEDKFNELLDLVKTKGSWDGGDQGVLNEWRGNNWNRLSFTYNTTPTAAYTYAPAYERFGSSIKAIHFIGPNKPWASIPWRAPIEHPSSEAARSYGYSDLVDRWFAVYDKYYRPSGTATEEEYQVRKYEAAWESKQFDASRLGLEELKRLAIEGVATAASAPYDEGEGEYKSLPLEGRVDLMRSQKPEEEHVEYHDPFHSVEQPVVPESDLHDHPEASHEEQSHDIPHRPPSPPQVTWNPALEPPPRDMPSEATFTERWYSNVWDLPSSRSNHSAHEQNRPPVGHTHQHSHQWAHQDYGRTDNYNQHVHESRPEDFFYAPVPSHITSNLGHYTAVTNDENLPRYDKVEAVFPWEKRHRPPPSRVFPDWEPKPPGLQTPPPVAEATYGATESYGGHHSSSPPLHVQRRFNAPPSPPKRHGSAYVNAWDNDASIRLYASSLQQTPNIFSAQPWPMHPGQQKFAKKRPPKEEEEEYTNWAERAEASSRDGDDEDDEIDSPLLSPRSAARRRASKAKGENYRHQGVQTDPKKTESRGVQVNTISAEAIRILYSGENEITQTSPYTGYGGTASYNAESEPNLQYPRPGTMSPREHDYAHHSTQELGTPLSLTAAFGGIRSEPNHGYTVPAMIRRELSGDTGTTAAESSAISSPGSDPDAENPRAVKVEQAEDLGDRGLPVADGTPVRRAARVFSPTTGVDIFKRTSQDVLARFLNQGPANWDHTRSTGNGPPTPHAIH